MSAAQYAYLHTRINLYASQLLDGRQLDAYIDNQHSEDLRDTAQANLSVRYSSELDQNNITMLLNELAILARPLSGAPRELLEYWAHRFEIGNLKTIIRGKMTNHSRQVIEGQLQDMGTFTSLPIEELLQSDSLSELLRRLEQTPYSGIARQVHHQLEQGEALFALDAALDRQYFSGLARRGMVLGKDSEQFLRSLVGSIIDRVNLVWLLRYRYAYNLPPAQAYYLLIPASHRLQSQQMQQLAQCDSFQDALNGIPSPFDKLLVGAHDTTEVTLRLEQESWRIATNVLSYSSFNVARALAYIMLRERDLRRLRAIASGHNMSMSGSAIRNALGLVESRQGTN